MAVFLLVVVGLGGPEVGFLVDAEDLGDAGGNGGVGIVHDGANLRQQFLYLLVHQLVVLLALLKEGFAVFLHLAGSTDGCTAMHPEILQQAQGKLVFQVNQTVTVFPKDTIRY